MPSILLYYLCIAAIRCTMRHDYGGNTITLDIGYVWSGIWYIKVHI